MTNRLFLFAQAMFIVCFFIFFFLFVLLSANVFIYITKIEYRTVLSFKEIIALMAVDAVAFMTISYFLDHYETSF